MIAASALGFVVAVTFGTFDLWAYENVGVFYDYQAQSLLAGRLDVPDEAIRDEAFVVGGRYYGYFGPTPAILRLPFAWAGVPPGHLTKVFMLGYFVGLLWVSYQLLAMATSALRRDPQALPSVWAITVLLGSAGLGSTAFFLGARPMMYHEAVACGLTFALVSAWCSLRQLSSPAPRWWLLALLCGVLAAHARATCGLFALTLLGLVAGWQWVRGVHPHGGPAAVGWLDRPRRLALAIGLLAVGGALSLSGLAYLKFGTFDTAPFQYSRPYADPARYARVDGRKFHLVNVPWGTYSYFGRLNCRLEPRFPYFFAGGREPPRTFSRAKIDLADWLVPVPYAMPGLFALATAGALIALLRFRAARLPLLLVWLAAAPMTLLLVAFIAIAQRYSGDLCPWLIASAIFGVAALDSLSGVGGRLLRVAFSILALVGILITSALVFEYQAFWGPAMPESIHRHHEALRQRIDGFLCPPSP
ncbi:hypothetical protein DB354_14850 [Opitutus sp. ER46]|nr:hypothetical protein DB354_14850 [Opitutus sp. ER46]